jgi:hypothetical protein
MPFLFGLLALTPQTLGSLEEGLQCRARGKTQGESISTQATPSLPAGKLRHGGWLAAPRSLYLGSLTARG